VQIGRRYTGGPTSTTWKRLEVGDTFTNSGVITQVATSLPFGAHHRRGILRNVV
jgi:hypothetical protein